MNDATLDRVRQIVAEQSGTRLDRLTATSAIDHDVKISGDDVAELAVALSKAFCDDVMTWPWQRFAELNEGLNPFVFPWLLWRLLTRPLRGRLFDPNPFEHLRFGHIAAVIDRGDWFEP